MSNRRCFRCSREKPETEFYRRGDSFVASCKSCCGELQKAARQRRLAMQAEADAMFARSLLRTGPALSLDQIEPEELI